MTRTRAPYAHAALLLVALLATACAASRPAVRFRAVYLDMDGTLLDDGGAIRPAVSAALADYRRCGGLVGIASGRIPRQVQPYLAEVQPDLPLLLANGALVLTPDGTAVVRTETVPRDVGRAALAAALAMPEVSAAVVQLAARAVAARRAPALDAWSERSGVAVPDDCASVEACLPDDLPDGGPLRILFFVPDGRAEAVAAALAPTVGDGARVIARSREAVEVSANDANKGAALAKVAAERGIALADIVAFGDGGNDAEMLAAAGVGVVMAECEPPACEAALVRTHANDTDAIAWVLRRLVMAPECAPAAKLE